MILGNYQLFFWQSYIAGNISNYRRLKKKNSAYNNSHFPSAC